MATMNNGKCRQMFPSHGASRDGWFNRSGSPAMVVAVASAGREVLPPRLLPQRQADVMMMNLQGLLWWVPTQKMMMMMLLLWWWWWADSLNWKIRKYGTLGHGVSWKMIGQYEFTVKLEPFLLNQSVVKWKKSLGNFSFWFIFCSGNYAEPPKWYLLLNNTPADRLM